MRSNRSPKLLAIALSAVLAGCSDATAPTASSVDSGPRFKVSIDNMASDLSSADFTVTPSGGTFRMGPHSIVFPAHSICDPERSTYGPTEWDKPCVRLDEPIQIHAELKTVDGFEFVDFTPSLRFAPARNANRWVMISMHAASLETYKNRSLNILWSPFDGAPGIDESLTDPTLKTRTQAKSGTLVRRIKHFSGYQVSAGYGTEILVDTMTVGTDTQ